MTATAMTAAGRLEKPQQRRRAAGVLRLLRQRVCPPLAVLVVVLGSWQIASLFVSNILISSPWATARALGPLLTQQLLWDAVATSAKETAIGGAVGITGGAALGVLIAVSNHARSLLMPFVNFMNATPLVVLIPLLVIWVGVDANARILFVALISTWPMLLNVLAGVRNVPVSYREVGTAFDLSRAQIVRKIVIPAAVPYILTGLRLASAMAIIGTIISEIEVSFQGLGFLLTNFGTNFQTDKLLATVIVTAAFGVVIVGLINLVRRCFFPWIFAIAGGDR
ncbi:MAG: ABC transporter permease [Streptosporangiaceae bacterium]